MVKALLVLSLLIMTTAHGQIFDFGANAKRESRIPALVLKLKNLEMTEDPSYDETFNQTIKAIETTIEEEKLFCSGDVTDSEGKTLPAAQKQLCMRELKTHYLNAMETTFEMKRKYLGMIHKRQLERLIEIQSKLKTDIEKNF